MSHRDCMLASCRSPTDRKSRSTIFFICFISLSLFECFYDVNVQTGCLLLLKVLNLLKQKKSASLMQYFCNLIIYRIK